jgi:hypothetical protein
MIASDSLSISRKFEFVPAKSIHSGPKFLDRDAPDLPIPRRSISKSGKLASANKGNLRVPFIRCRPPGWERPRGFFVPDRGATFRTLGPVDSLFVSSVLNRAIALSRGNPCPPAATYPCPYYHHYSVRELFVLLQAFDLTVDMAARVFRVHLCPLRHEKYNCIVSD